MFSGIVESTEKVIHQRQGDNLLAIEVTRPHGFQDLNLGDSIAINGVCLTLEAFDDVKLQFSMGHETLQVLGDSLSDFLSKNVNVERSLAFGARVHGHLVSGHVDAMVIVTQSEALGENWLLQVKVPLSLSRYLLKKGSLALNGVSLTINQLQRGEDFTFVDVCLIPETQRRTNLSQFRVGDRLCFEADSFVKTIVQTLEQMNQGSSDIQGHQKNQGPSGGQGV